MSENKKQINSYDPIDCLNLNIRTYHSLRRAKIETVGELISLLNDGNILNIRGVGVQSHDEIVKKLSEFQIINIHPETEIFHQNDDTPQLSSDLKGEEEDLIISKYDTEYMGLLSFYKRGIDQIFLLQQESIYNQIRLGILHKNVIISKKYLYDYLKFNRNDIFNNLKVFSKLLGHISVSEELNLIVSKLSQRDILFLLNRFGYKKNTYQEIAEKFSITRERVRQIIEKIKKIICRIAVNILYEELETRNVYLTRIQSALLYAKDMGNDLSFESWSNHLITSGLLGNTISKNIEKFDLIELMLAICNLLEECEIKEMKLPENLKLAFKLAMEGKPNVRVKNTSILKSTSRETKKQIYRILYFTGAVNSKWLSNELGLSNEQINEILVALGLVRIDQTWFVLEKTYKKDMLGKNDILDHTIRKMNLFCGPLNSSSLCSGLRHAVSRTNFPVPPADVLEVVLEKSGYKNEEKFWYWPGEIDEALNKGEKIIFKCLADKGPVVHNSELAQAFIESDLSFPSLHATLRRTPLIKRLGHALYKLRGKTISQEDINRAINEGKRRIPTNLEIIPETTGIIHVIGSLGTLALGYGTFFTDRLPNLSGEWSCFVDDVHFDPIRVVSNEIRGLLKPFQFLNCQVGDRVCMSFNTWNRTVSLKKELGNER